MCNSVVRHDKQPPSAGPFVTMLGYECCNNCVVDGKEITGSQGIEGILAGKVWFVVIIASLRSGISVSRQ